MKVPNKILNIIAKIILSAESTGAAGVSSEEIALVKQWAADGTLKRSLLAASVGQKAAAEVE